MIIFGLNSVRVVHIKKVWDGYLTLTLHSPSPTINSSLNFGTIDYRNIYFQHNPQQTKQELGVGFSFIL